MSIDLVRVDNRLIHGQVLEAWVPYLHAERIVVVDDETANDPLKRSILELAAPRSLKVDILTLNDALALYNRNGFDGCHCMVLFAGPCQAYAAYQAGFRFGTLNVGNVHFAAGKTRVSPSVCVDQEEYDVLRSMARAGVKIEIRAVPRETCRFITADGSTPAT